MKKYLIFPILALLIGCAQMGLAPAKTFNERLAYSYASHTAVLQAATSSLQAGSITPADAKQVLKLADESRALLDAARITGNPVEAQNKLLLAATILTQLQQYLNSHGVK